MSEKQYQEDDELLQEFEELILNVSKEVIDTSVMDDLVLLRDNLTQEMADFSQKAEKVNNVIISIDNLLSQTSANMSHAVNRTTDELTNFLKDSTKTLDDHLKAITSDLLNILDQTRNQADDQFALVTRDMQEILSKSENQYGELTQAYKDDFDKQLEDFKETIRTLLNETSDRVISTVDVSKNEMKEVMSLANTSLDNSIDTISEKLGLVLAERTSEFESVITRTTQQLDDLVDKTSDAFKEEVASVKDYLINSDKLIRNNQKSLTDVQRNIEKSLSDMLVHVVEQTDINRENLGIVISRFNDFIDQSSQELYGMKELNNTINIKADYILNKVKDQEKKSKNRFLIMVIINAATVLGVMGLLVSQFIGG